MNFFSRPALLEQARHLGLAVGETLAAESFGSVQEVLQIGLTRWSWQVGGV
jgi:hypothetical protein